MNTDSPQQHEGISHILRLRVTALTQWNNQMLDAKLGYLADGSPEGWLSALEQAFTAFPSEAGSPPTRIEFVKEWIHYVDPKAVPHWLAARLHADKLPKIAVDSLDDVELVDAYTEVVLKVQATWESASTDLA